MFDIIPTDQNDVPVSIDPLGLDKFEPFHCLARTPPLEPKHRSGDRNPEDDGCNGRTGLCQRRAAEEGGNDVHGTSETWRSCPDLHFGATPQVNE